MSEWSFITDGFAYYVLFAIIVSSLFVMALLGVNEKFNRWRIPLVALSFVVAIGATYVSLGELLSRPKPIDILTWDRPATDKAKVEGVYFIHGKAIFLLLMYEGIPAPRYYRYPWSEEMARQLKKSRAAEAMKKNQGTFLKNPFPPFQHSWEDRKFPEVYELPWPAPPPKDSDTPEIINLDNIDV